MEDVLNVVVLTRFDHYLFAPLLAYNRIQTPLTACTLKPPCLVPQQAQRFPTEMARNEPNAKQTLKIREQLDIWRWPARS